MRAYCKTKQEPTPVFSQAVLRCENKKFPDKRNSQTFSRISERISSKITLQSIYYKILACTRILGGSQTRWRHFSYDKVDTKFGKLRKLPVSGFVVEAAALQNDPRRQLYSFPYLFRYSLGEDPVSFLKQA